MSSTASLFLPGVHQSSYGLTFDSTMPANRPGDASQRAVSAIEPLRKHRTFAEKFPVDQVASGFQLWFELFVWDLVAEVDAATASLEVAACEDLARFLDEPLSPQERLGSNKERLLFGDIRKWRPWFCAPEERAWQLHVLATAMRTNRTAQALDACTRSVRPRLALIDEPERHLNAAIVKEAAAWLHSRARAGQAAGGAGHALPRIPLMPRRRCPSRTCRSCCGRAGLHILLSRGPGRLGSRRPRNGLDHGEIFGLSNEVVWVEGPMDRAVLEALCEPELTRIGAHIASYGGLGNMRSVLENPISRLPNLRFVVLVDDLTKAQLRRLREDPESVGVADSDEMRRTAQLIRQARASGRQIEIASHGAPDIFLGTPTTRSEQSPSATGPENEKP